MNDLIVRDVQVKIAPTVSEIAKLIWDMDAEITGINKKTIWKRYHKGWSSEEILKEG